MAIIVSGTEKNNYTPIEAGAYYSLCYGLVEIGYTLNEKFGNVSKKLRIFWELDGAGVETINNVEVNKSMSKEYTASLSPKGNLRKDLRAWRSREFTDEELERFELNNILGAPCQIQVIHTTGSNGNTYANIASIGAIPKRVKDELKATRAQMSWDYNDNEIGDENWEALPEWLRDMIKASESYKYITTNDIGHLSDYQIAEIEETNAFKKYREKNGEFPVIDDDDGELPF